MLILVLQSMYIIYPDDCMFMHTSAVYCCIQRPWDIQLYSKDQAAELGLPSLLLVHLLQLVTCHCLGLRLVSTIIIIQV